MNIRLRLYLANLFFFFSFFVTGQTLITSETFDEAFGAQAGTMSGGEPWDASIFGNCDADGPGNFGSGWFWGVSGGEFLCEDVEGFNCCGCSSGGAPECGDNQNVILFGPIDITTYSGISIVVDVTDNGEDMECVDNLDQGCPGVPLSACNGGNDQVVFEYSIDGGAWTLFEYLCGNQYCISGLGSIACGLEGDDLEIRITMGTQANDEIYSVRQLDVFGFEPDDIIISVDPDPGTDMSFCNGENVTLEEIASNAVNWSWSGPNSGSGSTLVLNDIQVSDSGIYTVEITDINGCTGTEQVNIQVTSAGPPATDPNITDCDDNLMMYDLTSEDGNVDTGGGNTVTWWNGEPGNGGVQFPDPATNVDITGFVGGGLWAQVDNGAGCTSNVMVTVTEMGDPVIADPNIMDCDDNLMMYDLTLENGNVDIGGGNTVTWWNGQPSAGGTEITPATNVDITGFTGVGLWAQVETLAGCISEIAVTVTDDNSDPVPTDFDITDCTSGLMMYDLTGENGNADPGGTNTVTWWNGEPGNGGVEYNPATNVDLTIHLVPGNELWVQLEDLNGCRAAIPIDVMVEDPMARLTGGGDVCLGDCTDPTTDVSFGITGGTEPYDLNLTINGFPIPGISVNLNETLRICYTDTPLPPFGFSYDGGSNPQTLTLSNGSFPPGSVTVELLGFTDANGCAGMVDPAMNSVTVTLVEPEMLTINIDGMQFCSGDPDFILDLVPTNPSAGMWLVDGVAMPSSTFNSAGLSPGMHTIDYVPAPGECYDVSTANINVIPRASVSVMGGATLCPGQCTDVTTDFTFEVMGGQGPNFQVNFDIDGAVYCLHYPTVTSFRICIDDSGGPVSSAPDCSSLPCTITFPGNTSGTFDVEINSFWDIGNNPLVCSFPPDAGHVVCNASIGNPSSASYNVLQSPEPNDIPPVEGCYDVNGIATFDLTALESQIYIGSPGTIFTWFENDCVTPISDPMNYEVISPNPTASVCYEVNENGCIETGFVTLEVMSISGNQVAIECLGPDPSECFVCIDDPSQSTPLNVTCLSCDASLNYTYDISVLDNNTGFTTTQSETLFGGSGTIFILGTGDFTIGFESAVDENGCAIQAPFPNNTRIIVELQPMLDNPGDEALCGSDLYTFPPITGNNLPTNPPPLYWTSTGGTGNFYSPGQMIDGSVLPSNFFIYAQNGHCTSEEVFFVDYAPGTIFDAPNDVTVCSSFTFPEITGTDLTGNEFYSTQVNGGGIVYNEGDVYSTVGGPTTFYIYDVSDPNCSPNNPSFDVTVLTAESAGDDVMTTVCDGEMLDLTTLLTAGAVSTGVFCDDDGAGLSGSIFDTTGENGNTYNFTYKVDNPDPCSDSTALLTVTVQSTVSAGDDSEEDVCQGDIYDLNNFLPSNASAGGTWSSTDVGGELSGSMFDATGISTGNYDFIYTVGGNGCPETNSTLTVTVLTQVAINPIMNVNECDMFVLAPITGMGIAGAMYYDMAGGAGNSYAPGDVIMDDIVLFAYYDNGNCNDEESFTINIEPTPNAGEDGTIAICEGFTGLVDFEAQLGATFDAGGIWDDMDGAGVLFDSPNPSMVAVSSVLQGNYTISYTVDNGICSDVAMVELMVDPPFNAGTDLILSICNEEGTPNIDFITQSGAETGGTLTEVSSGPSSGVVLGNGTSVDFDGVDGGVYLFEYIIPAAGNCLADTAMHEVTVFEQPTVGLAIATTICEGSMFDLFDALSDETPGGVFCDDTGAPVSNIINAGASGTVLTYTYKHILGADDPCMTPAPAVITITVSTTLSAGIDTTGFVCEGDILDMANVISATGDNSGVFESLGGAPALSGTIFTADAGSAGSSFNYNYIVGDGDICPRDTAVLTVSVDENPTGSLAGFMNNLCANDCSDITLSFGGDAGFNYSLLFFSSDGQNMQLDLAEATTMATLTLCNTNGELIVQGAPSVTVGNISDMWNVQLISLSDQNCNGDVSSVPIFSFDTGLEVPDTNIDDITICEEDQFEPFPGEIFDINRPTGSFTLQSELGCDSTVNVDLQFYPVIVGDFMDELCPGQSVVIGDMTFDVDNPSGLATIVDGSVNGCDSMVNVAITFADAGINRVMSTECLDFSITLDGVVFDINNPSDTLTLTGQAASGCDSLIYVDLDFYPQIPGVLMPTICVGDEFMYNGTIYDVNMTSGQETLLGQGANGCDSLVDVSISFYPQNPGELMETICPGSQFVYNGTVYDANMTSGQETLLGQGANGCDSLVDVSIDFFTGSVGILDTFTCPGGAILYENTAITQATSPVDIVLSVPGSNGCDSVVTVTVIELQNPTADFEPTFCLGQDTVINGVIYDESNPTGTETLVGGASNGCDSIVNVNLSFDNPQIEISASAVPGNLFYTLNVDFGTIMAESTLWSTDDPTIDIPCGGLCPEIELELNVTTTITVEVFYGGGNCSVIDQITLNPIIKDPTIYVPTVISQNAGNSTNTVFNVYVDDGVDAFVQMKIYDRWGNLMFDSDKLAEPIMAGAQGQGWDGTYNGEMVNPGIYVYVVSVVAVVGPDNQLQTIVENKAGDITVIR